VRVHASRPRVRLLLRRGGGGPIIVRFTWFQQRRRRKPQRCWISPRWWRSVHDFTHRFLTESEGSGPDYRCADDGRFHLSAPVYGLRTAWLYSEQPLCSQQWNRG
jgi:hypothetical protein